MIHVSATYHERVAALSYDSVYVKISFGNLRDDRHHFGEPRISHAEQLRSAVGSSGKEKTPSVVTPLKTIHVQVVTLGGEIHFCGAVAYYNILFVRLIAVTFHLQPRQLTLLIKSRLQVVAFVFFGQIGGRSRSQIIGVQVGIGTDRVGRAEFFLSDVHYFFAVVAPYKIFIASIGFQRTIVRLVRHNVFGCTTRHGLNHDVAEFSVFPLIPMPVIELVVNQYVAFFQFGISVGAGYVFNLYFLAAEFIFSVGRNFGICQQTVGIGDCCGTASADGYDVGFAAAFVFLNVGRTDAVYDKFSIF